ncbi:MAG: BREX-3 system phosphatase PglZ [Candidatus Cloacimonetes bacterium]|nr:BREX-3 system phosphatase PglZ [Candidatus Cloacimonadota bacterium]
MAKTWRNVIADKFIPKLNRVNIAIDIDRLLADDLLVLSLRAKGFLVVPAVSEMQVRLEYEKYWKMIIEEKEEKDLLIVYQDDTAFSLPCDIFNSAMHFKVSFDDLFPKLSAAILKSISFELFDKVFDAYCDEDPKETLSNDKTCLFLLRTAFGIHCQEIKSDVDFLSLLLRLHYNKVQLPCLLAQFFAKYTSARHRLEAWTSTELLLTDASLFWTELQKAWNNTVLNSTEKDAIPGSINFCNPAIYVYLDNAFAEGFLSPVPVKKECTCPEGIPNQLFLLGMTPENKESLTKQHIQHVEETLLSIVPDENATVSDWLKFAFNYSEFQRQCMNNSFASKLPEKSNAQFVKWIKKRYDALHFNSSMKPIMLSKIADYLRRQKADGTRKIALLVVDGMSILQWLVIKDCLKENNNYSFEEDACFACIPTLTSVSRQSIFSGMLPLYYAESINSTAKEEKEWTSSWSNNGPVEYYKDDGLSNNADAILSQISPMTKVVGIVVNAVDELMHSSLLGMKPFVDNIKSWMEDGYLARLISGLTEKGYAVWITADHGNIEATGVGLINDGSLAETKGLRARVYKSAALRDSASDTHKDTMVWNSDTLPTGYAALLADSDKCFTKNGTSVISHGGISIEEVLVPFVRIRK